MLGAHIAFSCDAPALDRGFHGYSYPILIELAATCVPDSLF